MSVLRLWRDAHRNWAQAREYMKQRLARDEAYFEARDAARVAVSCMQRSRDVMRFALLALRDGEGDGPQQLREAFS